MLYFRNQVKNIVGFIFFKYLFLFKIEKKKRRGDGTEVSFLPKNVIHFSFIVSRVLCHFKRFSHPHRSLLYSQAADSFCMTLRPLLIYELLLLIACRKIPKLQDFPFLLFQYKSKSLHGASLMCCEKAKNFSMLNKESGFREE